MKMESPNKGGEKAPISHLSLPSEFSVPGMSYILLLGKGVPWKFLNNSGHCQGYLLASLQKTDGKVLLQKKTFTHLIGHGGMELETNESFHPCWLGFMVLEGTLHSTRGQR